MNLTNDGNHTTTQELFRTQASYGQHRMIFIAFNIPLSITAFLGNVLIIIAFQKASISLHPPSKLLFSCLASTDLCVGLVAQPLYVSFLLSSGTKQSSIRTSVTSTMFCGVSLLTITAISVDRLLALVLGLRYRQVVTLRRVWILVISCWLFSAVLLVTGFYNRPIKQLIVSTLTLVCIITSSFCYIKRYLALRQHQAQIQDHVHHGQPNGGGLPLNIARYRKTVSSALWVQITLVACYLPFGIAAGIIYKTESYTLPVKIARDSTVTLLYLNSSLNPFLYCWKLREVKQAVKNTITQFTCCFSN